MLFNSYIFIFLFLPLCLIGFYMLQNKQATLAKVWLTCFSLWFYGYFNKYYLLIMLCSIIGNYLIHGWIVSERKCQCGYKDNTLLDDYANNNKGGYKQKNRSRNKSKIVLMTGVILNLLVLFYFKYFDFFVENVNAVFGSSFPLKHILLPLGISFFTFQQISFLVDTYRGELEQYGRTIEVQDTKSLSDASRPVSFIDYALFVSFFPQLIAGPIVVHEEMMPQFARIGNDNRSREEKAMLFTKGVYVFTLGLAKKVLIADTFGVAVDFAYSNVNGINGLESLITIIFYSLQLYFDFSGYCDMAKGIVGMFGMKIANNFNSPYKAVNIVDFWKRWHITLSRFFTKNIYIPLGGNRKGEGRMYLNYLIVFFLSGLWHGAGWNFILWGMMHGVLYVATKWWNNRRKTCVIKKSTAQHGIDENMIDGKRKWESTLLKAVACIGTFVYVSVAWVYFRASSVEQANTMIRNIFNQPWVLPGNGFTDAFNLGEFWYMLKILKVATLPYANYYIMILFSVFALAITFWGKNIDELAEKFKPTVLNAVITAVLFIWCVVSLSGVSTFLYFNF